MEEWLLEPVAEGAWCQQLATPQLGAASIAAMGGVAGPRAVWRDRSRTHLLGLAGRTRPLRQRLLHGYWGGALGGRPEGARGRLGPRRAPARV